MRYFGGLGTFVVLLSSLIFLTKAWSSELDSKQFLPRTPHGVEAIVTKVDKGALTLKPTGTGMEIIVHRTDDGTLRVGDRVVLNGKDLKKVTEKSVRGVLTEKAKDGATEKPANPETTMPKSGGQ